MKYYNKDDKTDNDRKDPELSMITEDLSYFSSQSLTDYEKSKDQLFNNQYAVKIQESDNENDSII